MLVASLAYGQAGTITTIAGRTPQDGEPVRGFDGDGGAASNATLALANVQNPCDPGRLEQSVHLAVDASGSIYIADSTNHRIRRIKDNVIMTVAGSGESPAARCEALGPVGDGGSALAARLFGPADIAVHPSGDFIIADQQNNRIRRVTSSGVISTIAGSGMHNLYAPSIPATSSPMDWPSALAVDANGIVYFAEVHSHRVARIGSDGRLATIAGTGSRGYNGDGIQGPAAQLWSPTGIALDGAGNVYIADQGNHRIRRVSASGVITTIAGNGQPGSSGDGGPATAASLNTPMDVKVDASGNIYVADTLNHKVRRIDSAGRIDTVAGDGVPGRGPDDVAATASSLRTPAGLALDASGDLYIADWQNYLIRKVSFQARPAIASGVVVNAASFAGAPNPVAPGSIVSIVGTNLAPATRVAPGAPLPKMFDNTSVEVNGEAVPLFFISPGQINAQLPFDLAAGAATVVVRTASGVSQPEQFQVSASAPGLFQLDRSGRAAALNQNATVNAPDNPESAGNVVVVFLTGIGVVDPPIVSGEATGTGILAMARLPVRATVGGLDAEVLFAGMTPDSIGLGQTNIRIPSGIAGDSSVPVVVTIGTRASNSVMISVR